MTLTLVCPYCGFSREIREDRIPAGVSSATCPSCSRSFAFSPPPGDEPFVLTGDEHDAGVIPPGSGAPWEERASTGFWRGIFETFKGVLFSPDKFFRGMATRKGIGEPLAFGLIMASMGGMFGLFWQLLMMMGGGGDARHFFGIGLSLGIIFLILVIVVPIVVIVTMFIYSAVAHVLLRIVKGGSGGFEATFRVVAYSQAAQLWALIPFVGGFVGSLWQLVVQIIGLKEIHGTSYVRVIIAFLIPVALFVLLAVGFVLLIAFYFSFQT